MNRRDPSWIICLPTTTSAAEAEARMFNARGEHPQR
jgi:hypothetical protein